MERRTMIRLLVGFGIGIPILIELATFFGLIERQFRSPIGPGSNNGDSSSPSSPTADRVGIGDELFPSTDPEEILKTATLHVTSGPWELTLGVEVTNTSDSPYEFQLGTVTLTDGRQIPGAATTDRIPPGEIRSVEATWSLPEGTTPDRVTATGILYPPDAPPNETQATVPLAKIPATNP